MIDIKEATKNALGYLMELPNLKAESETIRLEEVELTDDDKFWLITLSFVDRAAAVFSEVFSPPARQYKTFRIDAESGQVRSMKIRQLEGA
jgi:hypothetical protein